MTTLRQSYLTLRHPEWHIRVAVPADVRDSVGTSALQKSLHTASVDVAVERARLILVQWQAEFSAARTMRPNVTFKDNILQFPVRSA